jgi:hypothetical protein
MKAFTIILVITAALSAPLSSLAAPVESQDVGKKCGPNQAKAAADQAKVDLDRQIQARQAHKAS